MQAGGPGWAYERGLAEITKGMNRRDERECGPRPQHSHMCRWEIKGDFTKETGVTREVGEEPREQCSGGQVKKKKYFEEEKIIINCVKCC